MIKLTSIFSILSPDTSNMLTKVSSEHVANTDLEGWQIRALRHLEWAAISTKTCPLGLIN